MAPDEVKAHPIRPQVRLPQQAKHKGQRTCCGVVVQSVKNSQELSYIMWPYRRFYLPLCEPACRTQGNAVAGRHPKPKNSYKDIM